MESVRFRGSPVKPFDICFPSQKWHGMKFPDGRSFVRMEVFASDLLTLRLLRQGNADVKK